MIALWQKHWQLIGIVVLLGIAAVVFFFGQGVIVGYGESQEDIRAEFGVWSQNDRVEQTFVASQNNLCRIDFFVDGYYSWNSPYLECQLFEIETTDDLELLDYTAIRQAGTLIRKQRLPGWLVSTHMFNSFTFEPLPHSANRRYLLSIQSPDLRPGGMFLLLGTPRTDAYDPGSSFSNGHKLQGELAFRLLYRRARVVILHELAQRLALQKPFPLAWSGIYYLLLAGYGGLLILFIAIVLLRERRTF